MKRVIFKFRFRGLGFTQRGFSLFEMLIVLFIFSVIAVVVGQALSVSLRSARKSEDVSIVKNEVEYAMTTMERLLRRAKSLDCGLSYEGRLVYIDEFGDYAYFECIPDSSTGNYIASGSGSYDPDAVRLTSPEVNILNCNTFFSNLLCKNFPPPSPTPLPIVDSVDIELKAKKRGQAQGQGPVVELKTKILLRNY